MTPERRQLIESLFESAARLPGAARTAFLDEACAGDASLRNELECLLRLEEEARDFLELPALQLEFAASGLDPDIAHPPGTRVGPYVIAAIVGSGGMGEVYQARDSRLGRDVAIKFIPRLLAQDARAVERFQREARASSALNHPHICSIYDVGEQEGQPYLVMELLRGCTLKERLAGGPLPAGQLADIALQLASALEAAHHRGIVHRDIKPANVFLSSDDSVKILDFGVAKLLAEPREPSDTAADRGGQVTVEDTITVHGVFLGTAAYMSPQQIRGGEVDARSDLFSLGVLLYQAATGSLPFQGVNLAAIRAAILSEAPAAPRKVNPKIHRELERIILKLLEKDLARRYQNAGHLAADLARCKQRLGASGRRRRVAVSAAVVATLAAAAGLATRIFSPPGPPSVHLRQITTTTEQKNWPVVSDGSSIYYLSWDRETRVMQVPVSGGQSTALPLKLPGSHTHLFDLSPDGLELLLRADDRVGEAGALVGVRISDGSVRRIVPGGVRSARYSPDGRKIAWSTGSKVYVGAVDGSVAREIAARSGGYLTVLFWNSPERIILSFSRQHPSTLYPLGFDGFGGSSAWQVAPDGSGFRRLLPDWDREHDFAGFTSDGRHMLLVSSGTLWSVPVLRWSAVGRSGAPAQITFGTPALFVPHQSRDGRLFTVGDVRLGELQRFDPATHTWQRHLGGISADAVEYSRDGQWVAYVRYPEQSLWRCRADGTQCLQLADGRFGAWLPHWSPDSRTIAFQAQEAGKPWRIWLVSVDGSGLRRASRSDSEEQCNAAWTADGKRIVFGSAALPSLRNLNIETGEVTAMPGSDGLCDPRSSGDGSRLLARAVKELQSQANLTIFDPASGRWRQASDETGSFATWARDNKSVIYYIRGEIRRFRLDTWRAESVTRFDRYQAVGWKDWVGLDHDGAVLVMRNLDVRQIYELEFRSR